MEKDQNIQAEDSPSLEIPANKPSAEAGNQAPAKPGFIKRVLPWIIVAVAFFLAGACLVYFTLYTRANNDYKVSQTENQTLTEKLSSSDVDLQKAKTELSTAQASLVEANNSATQATKLSILYKFQSDINLARVSLKKLDPSSARQALSVAKDDLTALSATDIEADTIAGLQPQIDTAMTYLNSDPEKAMSALDTLYTNLLLISDNIK